MAEPTEAQRSYSPTHLGSTPPPSFVVPLPPSPPPLPPPLPLPGLLIGLVHVTPKLLVPPPESALPELEPLLEPELEPELLPLLDPLLDPELEPLLDPLELPEPLEPTGMPVLGVEEEHAPIAMVARIEEAQVTKRRTRFMWESTFSREGRACERAMTMLRRERSFEKPGTC
jgi:hypothetical protein